MANERLNPLYPAGGVLLNELLAEMGENIPDNADLNNYTKPGRYYCSSTAHAQTMTNLPDTANNVGAFTLFVTQIGLDWTKQILLRAAANSIWIRLRNQSTKSWESWTKLH